MHAMCRMAENHKPHPMRFTFYKIITICTLSEAIGSLDSRSNSPLTSGSILIRQLTEPQL